MYSGEGIRTGSYIETGESLKVSSSRYSKSEGSGWTKCKGFMESIVLMRQLLTEVNTFLEMLSQFSRRKRRQLLESAPS